MSLASIPDLDDTQEFSTPNPIRVCHDSVPSYHSCTTLPTLNSLSEIKEDMSLVRISSMDRIRMNFKSKLTIRFGTPKSESTIKEDCDPSLDELMQIEELPISPQLQKFVDIAKQKMLAPGASAQKREHVDLLKNLGEMIRNALVQDNALEMHCETIFFSFGGFWEIFEKKATLGQGCSGVVNKCCRRSNPSEEYAVKVVNTNGDEELILKTIQEYKNYKRLCHKSIVNIHELHIDLLTNKTYLLMELVKGKELQSHLASKTQFDEKTASHIMKELLCGIKYLHSRGVVHRDIKLENIIVSEDYKVVKIADLNVSKFFDEKSYKYFSDRRHNFQMWTYTGTVAFLAPEVFIDLEYSESIDIWGAGVVLYTMLSGNLPFQSEYQDDLINKIKRGEFQLEGRVWNRISDDAKNLISNLLQKDANLRYTASEALAHRWIVNKGHKTLCDASPSHSKKNLIQFLEQLLVPKRTMTL